MVSDCVHHWILPAQSGPLATATCKKCGAQRDFETGEVLKRWTMPPTDPRQVQDTALRVSGKATQATRGKLKAHAKTASSYRLETDVDRT